MTRLQNLHSNVHANGPTTMVAYTVEHLESLSRRDLQSLAKEHGHKANQASAKLIELLLSPSDDDDDDDDVPANVPAPEVVVPMDAAGAADDAAADVDEVAVPVAVADEVVQPEAPVMEEEEAVESVPDEVPQDAPVAGDDADVVATQDAAVLETEEAPAPLAAVVASSSSSSSSSSSTSSSQSAALPRPRQSTAAAAPKALGRPAIVPKPNKATLMRQEALSKKMAGSAATLSTTTAIPAVAAAATAAAKTDANKKPSTSAKAPTNTFTAFSGASAGKAVPPKSPAAKSPAAVAFKARSMPNFSKLHSKFTVKPATISSSKENKGNAGGEAAAPRLSKAADTSVRNAKARRSETIAAARMQA